jgi:lipopolysaccharide export system ATP-binding protein
MKLAEFVRSLKPQDAAIGIGLVELIRRADHRGAIERGDWLAAVRAAYARAGTGTHEGAMGEGDAPEELDRYVEEHILERLASEQLVVLEPPGEGWERARVEPGLWTDVCLAASPSWRTSPASGQPAGRALAHADACSRIRHRSGGSTLSARGLVKVYRKRRAVADVNLEVAQGEIVGLLGPNGAGKTTTFYMIVGLIGPDAGRVFLDQAELTRTPMYKRARAGIGYLAQEPSIFRKLTVEQNILAILETMPLPRAEKRARLERLLGELGIKHLRKAKAYSLSGGERRRLEITRARAT